MSHPLRIEERVRPEALGRVWGAVEVEAVGNDLVIRPEAGVFVAKADSLWMPLPERIAVRAPEGKVVSPSRGRTFFVSAETFDPYHAVLEAPCLPLPEVSDG